MSTNLSEEPSGNFWQINVGHILTIAVMLASVCVSYGSLSSKIESQGGQITAMTSQQSVLSSAVSALQISGAAEAQDRADLHRTMDQDFARRISKLEDETDAMKK